MLLLLAGCASSRVPQAISKASEKPVLVSQVQQAPDRFLDRRMRWGGTILAVRNRKRANEIEILSRPLESGGQPRGKEPGQGRFLLALLTGFADPAGYSEKRLLAVTGRLKRVEARPIGEYPYPYPVVAIEQSYLWPKPSPPVPPYHFHPDPWYHPWYYPGTLDTLGTGRMKCSTAASMRYPGIFIICPFLLAVGCASNPPCLTSIGTSFITPSVASATGKYVGKPAQWGGTLLDTHHFKDRTEFEMIAYPLDGCGRPHVGFGPTGRFIIVHPRFLDTTDYQIGQAVSATPCTLR